MNKFLIHFRLVSFVFVLAFRRRGFHQSTCKIILSFSLVLFFSLLLLLLLLLSFLSKH